MVDELTFIQIILFALWKDEKLVTFAKAYSGLTDMEIREVDRFIKQNTIDRFGPVRQVKPELVLKSLLRGLLHHLVTKVVLLYVSQGFYIGVMTKK